MALLPTLLPTEQLYSSIFQIEFPGNSIFTDYIASYSLNMINNYCTNKLDSGTLDIEFCSFISVLSEITEFNPNHIILSRHDKCGKILIKHELLNTRTLSMTMHGSYDATGMMMIKKTFECDHIKSEYNTKSELEVNNINIDIYI